jgi:hypothetical protein
MNSNPNGRVNILNPNTQFQFSLFKTNNANGTNGTNDTTSYNDALVGNWNDTLLSNAFFSSNNMTIIQNGIRAGVFKISNGRYSVAPQDETNLKIIMRSIFLQNARNDPNNITEQLSELNNLVLKYCIPNVFSEATAYIKYKNDVSTLAVPMKRPAFVSVKGDKQLELKHWF